MTPTVAIIVALIALSGVIFTLLFNARQAREQRREERRHDCETLRAALLAELRINRGSLKENIETSKESSNRPGAFVPTDPMDDAYRAYTHRLGLLSPDEVHKVMLAHLSLRAYRAKLILIGKPTDTGGRFVEIGPDFFEALPEMQEGLMVPIDDAIQAMERAQDAG